MIAHRFLWTGLTMFLAVTYIFQEIELGEFDVLIPFVGAILMIIGTILLIFKGE